MRTVPERQALPSYTGAHADVGRDVRLQLSGVEGAFYPADLPAAKMLPYYAERFRTVEINYTFYRMPNAKMLAGWVAETPPGFRFTLKAPKRITHDRRLKDVGDLVRGFCELAATLGDRLAALLFQLPPNLKCDLDVFDAFLDTLPPKVTAAFEFRHDVVARRRGLRAPARAQPRALHRRHRRSDDADRRDRRLRLLPPARRGLSACRSRALGAARSRRARDRWRETFVYFKHEDEGKGPEFARALTDSARATALGRQRRLPSPDSVGHGMPCAPDLQ